LEDKLQHEKSKKMLLTKIWATCSTDQKHEIGRLKLARTKENVTTVDKMETC